MSQKRGHEAVLSVDQGLALLEEIKAKSPLGGNTAFYLCIPGHEYLPVHDIVLTETDQSVPSGVALIRSDRLEEVVDHSVPCEFQPGDEVIDTTAEGAGWQDVNGVVQDLSATVQVLYESGRTHWRKAENLRMAHPCCPKCDAELDQDCFGKPRCPNCDPPCPGCDDGGGPIWERSS